MAFLVIGPITVPVATDPTAATSDVAEIGDRVRAWDGTVLSTIRAWKDEVAITTTPMTRVDADALEAVLRGTPPVACSGDVFGGAVNCHVTTIRKRYEKVGNTERVVLSFSLIEE